ncbi:MAG: FadR family transcriptional regulator [Desulfarculaceae bacterium]|nr:FadR family transcriptional regulator [Desulfarculaceae bacterium]MCF8074464.1 FadR family transcriptional regulator [Desulfarculaceae bacterium]MCF8103694.1 FadR family transcriptional regulator [Desulfarculaceae bacterium]MCF8118134.1 FadR family transcriptional regulator [Desulfarculaceae bacterium]
MPRFKSLKKPSLAEEVQAQLIDSITSGLYAPGQKLPAERELMEQFEVSRVTVRGALTGLKSMGLVYIKRGVNGGTFVAEPSAMPITESFKNLVQMGRVNFRHLIEARLYLEPALAMAAAKTRNQHDVERLDELLQMARQQLNKSLKKARMQNVRFHNEVARISSNPILLFISESITQTFSGLMIDMTEDKLSREKIEGLIGEHQDILQDIKDQEPDLAYSKTRAHLLKTYDIYKKVMPFDNGEGDLPSVC